MIGITQTTPLGGSQYVVQIVTDGIRTHECMCTTVLKTVSLDQLGHSDMFVLFALPRSHLVEVVLLVIQFLPSRIRTSDRRITEYPFINFYKVYSPPLYH